MNLAKTTKRNAATETVAEFASRHGLDAESCRLAANRGAIVANGRTGRLELAGGIDPATLRKPAPAPAPAVHDEREYRAGDVPSAMPRDDRTMAQRTSLQARREPARRQAHRAAAEQARRAAQPQPRPKTSTGTGYRREDVPTLSGRAAQRQAPAATGLDPRPAAHKAGSAG